MTKLNFKFLIILQFLFEIKLKVIIFQPLFNIHKTRKNNLLIIGREFNIGEVLLLILI